MSTKTPISDATLIALGADRGLTAEQAVGFGRAVEALMRKRKPKAEQPVAAASGVWASYSEAFCERYGVLPVRNARVNAQLAQFCARVPKENAAVIARWYVKTNKQWYVSKMHPISALLNDAEQLAASWARGRSVAYGDARQADLRAERDAQVERLSAETL